MPILSTAVPFASFAGRGFDRLTTIAETAVFLATAIAVVTVIALVLMRWPPLRRRIRVCAQRHEEIPWWLSWVAGTALHLGAFTASPGAGDAQALAAVLSAQLGGAGVRRPLAGVDLAATPYRTSSALEDISEAVKGLPNGKALAALIKLGQKLLPRSDLYLTGYLLSSPERGAGLVLSIVSDSGQVRSSGTLWSDILEPTATAEQRSKGDVLRLAIAGAVWAQFQLIEELNASVTPYAHTVNWRSASLFEVAVHDEGSRDNRGLRALYALALDRDPDNLPALFNLAVLELHAGFAALACARLLTLLEALKQDETKANEAIQGGGAEATTATTTGKRDPLYYQAHYSLAVALQTVTPGQAADAAPWLYRVTRELEADIIEASDEVERNGNGGVKKPSELRSLHTAEERLDTLKRIEGPFLVLAAIRRQAQLEQVSFRKMGDPKVGRQLAPTAFTRGELISTLSAWEEVPPNQRTTHKPNPQTLAFGHVEGDNPEASYRVHYNRACYATAVAKRIDERAASAASEAERRGAERESQEALGWALAKLECALEPGDLIEWARRDPSFDYLKQERTADFNALVKPGS